jgi:hypothetical protein
MPGWIVTAMAVRGNKAAFTAYPTLPEGSADLGAQQQGGQIDLETGQIDWLVPLGKGQNDYYLTYDIAVAPNGDVILCGTGYGEPLLGSKLGQFDGFVASFDTFGKKRFAQRLEIFDIEPNIAERPQIVGATIVTDDVIRIRTSFYVTNPGQAMFTAVHVFSFTLDGMLTYRAEVPQVPGTFGTATWPAADGTLWIFHPPGPLYQYSKTGSVLNTLTPPNDGDLRGFAAMGPTSGLINLTTNGITNELYHFDVESSLVPLFNEPIHPEFHAATLVHSLGFAKTYFVETGYTGLSHRFARIDTKGSRSLVTALEKVNHRFALLDNGDGVFFRIEDSGTEWIVQPL